MLYTRKGDGGESNLLDRNGLRKDSPIFEALGTLDELNSFLGICKIHACGSGEGSSLKGKSLACICEELQQHLFIIQAELAGSDKCIKHTHVVRLEEIADNIERELPPIKSFLLPGATLLSAHFDYARTIARRAERGVLSLEKKENISDSIYSYMNRVSSVLYALARFSAYKNGAEESTPSY